MVIYVEIDKDNFVKGWGSTSSKKPNEIEIDVEDDHEVLRNPHIFKYVNGELVKDEDKQEELLNEDSTKPNKESMQSVAILELAERIAALEGGD